MLLKEPGLLLALMLPLLAEPELGAEINGSGMLLGLRESSRL